MAKVAIHGFGRIGRTALRIALQQNLFVPVSISDIRDAQTFAALFEVDSNYGRWHEPVEADDSHIVVGGRSIPYFNSKDQLPDWAALGVDLVIDCTGRATTRAVAQQHLDRGAKKVLVSGPSKTRQDADAVLLPGINMDEYSFADHNIITMGSCTTNGLAPVVKVLVENFGIESALFTTVHAYTNSQSLTDQPMKDRRDSWAAVENIIPSSSGAAKALLYIWPDLKITGKAYRVPTRTGSIVEINAVLKNGTTVDAIKDAFRKAASTAPLKGVMGVLEDEWASARIVGDPHSSIVDLPLVQMMGDKLVSVAAWYDNEWGFTARLVETAAFVLTENAPVPAK
ncbi:MAG: glyceraldehyde 3-phosphate dehydrogenase NAD-binding domain-containing protein [Anaerolineae bacterium]